MTTVVVTLISGKQIRLRLDEDEDEVQTFLARCYAADAMTDTFYVDNPGQWHIRLSAVACIQIPKGTP